jgi:hypothetical protein
MLREVSVDASLSPFLVPPNNELTLHPPRRRLSRRRDAEAE